VPPRETSSALLQKKGEEEVADTPSQDLSALEGAVREGTKRTCKEHFHREAMTGLKTASR